MRVNRKSQPKKIMFSYQGSHIIYYEYFTRDYETHSIMLLLWCQLLLNCVLELFYIFFLPQLYMGFS